MVVAVSGETTAALVAAAAAGDRAAWDALVERYERLVFSVARSFRLSTPDAADVSQTVWLRFAERLDRLTDPDRAGAWLATTTRRECLRLLRSSDRVVPSDDVGERRVDGGEPVEAALLREERRAAMRAAFARVPERCQRLLRLLTSDPRHSYQEIAQLMPMPIGAIGPTRARCLARLRVEVASLLGPEPAVET